MENKLQNAAQIAASLFSELGLSELTIRDGEMELTLKKAPPIALPVASAADPTGTPAAPNASPAPAPTASVGENRSENRSALVNCHEVKSPLVGILYLTPAPGAKPFVSVGDRVSRGDVLCIVEAMKMMNEITADCEGTVLDICADPESLVEYGQVLFKIG